MLGYKCPCGHIQRETRRFNNRNIVNDSFCDKCNNHGLKKIKYELDDKGNKKEVKNN